LTKKFVLEGPHATARNPSQDLADSDVLHGPTTRARILKHFKVTAEKIALEKVNFSKGILKQPDISLTAVCHCGQDTYSIL
jgi:hypothetical protein